VISDTLVKVLRETVVDWMKYCSRIILEGLTKNTSRVTGCSASWVQP